MDSPDAATTTLGGNLTPPRGPRARKGAKGQGNSPRKARPRVAAADARIEESRALALTLAAAGLDKKAHAVQILDVVGRVDYADFLVLMTGRSDRQVDAISQAIEEAGIKRKRRALSVEGRQASMWILLDFGDVVAHVFQEQARGLYDIEGLWLDAKRLPVPSEPSD